jgi:putative zinc finger protein
MQHVTEEQLVHYRYGDVDETTRRVVEDHLRSCASCRESLGVLEVVLAAVDAAPVPQRGEGYSKEVWQRLAPRLEESRASRSVMIVRTPPWRRARPWAAVAAVAALVVAAFFLGRFWPRPGSPVPEQQAVSAAARDRVLLVAVGDHLERSQMVLIELENAKGAGPVDISAERDRAENLVAANRLYRQTAARAGEAGVASVLDELERVLVEIAHSPSEVSQGQLEELRHRIEAQGILFKVRVIDSQVKQRERTSAEKAGRGDT